MIIKWSIFAKKQISKIRKDTSFKTITVIYTRAKSLLNFPLLGEKEELLNFREENFRYLVEGNYKIIYWIDDEVIRIVSVFDTRQNPEKLKNLD
jgi:toxin ParE1/3/4